MEKIIETENKVYVVSDLHGDIKLFNKILSKMNFNQKNGDQLFVLGDIINGKSYGLEILDEIINNKYYFVLGNHEKALLYNKIDIMKFYNLNENIKESIYHIAKNYNKMKKAIISFYNANAFEGAMISFDQWFKNNKSEQQYFAKLLSELNTVDDRQKLHTLDVLKLLFNADPFSGNSIFSPNPILEGGYKLKDIIIEIYENNITKKELEDKFEWLEKQGEYLIVSINDSLYFLSHSTSEIDFHGLEFHWGKSRVPHIKTILYSNAFDYHISGHSPSNYVWKHLSDNLDCKLEDNEILKYIDSCGNKHIVIDTSNYVVGGLRLNDLKEFYTSDIETNTNKEKDKIKWCDEFLKEINTQEETFSLKEYLIRTNYYN